jgi:nitroreductase
MTYSRPVTDLIKDRFSCRTFLEEPIDPARRARLIEAVAAMRSGPLGMPVRFRLVAAATGDSTELRGLGTYGFIRGAAGFLIGASNMQDLALENYGYALEELVLLATDLGLGSCWLGGFSRRSFSRRIDLEPDESIPAVAALGMIADPEKARGAGLRSMIGASRRRSWEQLFFDGGFGTPLSRRTAGPWAAALEMVRQGPSASNRQPWRIVRQGSVWHFFLKRTQGYRSGLVSRLLGRLDIQQVDIGIAMCHFELGARDQGLAGAWEVRPPDMKLPDARIEYVISWMEQPPPAQPRRPRHPWLRAPVHLVDLVARLQPFEARHERGVHPAL